MNRKFGKFGKEGVSNKHSFRKECA